MGDKIYVPYQEAESEFVEKRSRFIGHIWPVDSEDQAQELLRRVKNSTTTPGTTAGAICWAAVWSATATTASLRAPPVSLCWRCSSGSTSPTFCAW